MLRIQTSPAAVIFHLSAASEIFRRFYLQSELQFSKQAFCRDSLLKSKLVASAISENVSGSLKNAQFITGILRADH